MTSLPVLQGEGVTLRPGGPGDAATLRQILSEPSVAAWWGEPEPVEAIANELSGGAPEVLFVIEIDGQVGGGIQYSEETEPSYRHAGIDIFLATTFQGRGAGAAAVRVMARYLFEERKHHRLTIDPAVANERAIRCYSRVGFRPVGVMRQYERAPDGTLRDALLMDMLAGEMAHQR